MSIKIVTAETLNGAVEFDSPFRIVGTVQGGNAVLEARYDLDGPEVHQFVDRDGQAAGEPDVSLTTWEPVTGYSGQHGYSGPVMHPSEFLGCRMADDILEDVGASTAWQWWSACLIGRMPPTRSATRRGTAIRPAGCCSSTPGPDFFWVDCPVVAIATGR